MKDYTKMNVPELSAYIEELKAEARKAEKTRRWSEALIMIDLAERLLDRLAIIR